MKTKKIKTKRNIGDELIKGLEQIAAFLKGEKNGVTVTRVPIPVPAPVANAIDALKIRREKSKLTVQHVSEESGIARETLTRLESGAIPNPTYNTLAAYARALGCRIELSVVNGVKAKGKQRKAG